ncbi:MAG: NAD-dependent epimerase/dehydratase family protein [Mycobacterium sp.]
MAVPRKVLVMGASGFVGSHVTRQLVERGDDVRVLLRKTSPTVGIDDLDVQRRYGDIFDDDAVRAAMADRDVVFYCVVDARAMLPDPAPLFRTNVEGLRHVLDIAADAELQKFVYLSTIGTIAVSRDGAAVTEDTPFNWADKGGPYIEARRTAEDMVFRYVRERGLPAVALNVSTPYGPGDWQPTPHGGLVARAASGKMPFYVRGVSAEVVGVEDAAGALLLAAEHGRNGQRYIISESYLSMRGLFEIAARETGVAAPRLGIPLAGLFAAAYAAEPVRALRPRKITPFLNVVRLAATTSPADHGKATRELGWQPKPVAEAIRRAAEFYVERSARKGGC